MPVLYYYKSLKNFVKDASWLYSIRCTAALRSCIIYNRQQGIFLRISRVYYGNILTIQEKTDTVREKSDEAACHKKTS